MLRLLRKGRRPSLRAAQRSPGAPISTLLRVIGEEAPAQGPPEGPPDVLARPAELIARRIASTKSLVPGRDIFNPKLPWRCEV